MTTVDIPQWVGDIFDELDIRYENSDQSFMGPMLFLRWNLPGRDGKQLVCLHAPSEDEAAYTPFYAGRHWMGYERQGRDYRRGSPAWELDIEMGVDATRLDVCFMTDFTSFPAEPYAEALHSAEHHVRSPHQWTHFRDTVLDGLLAELIRRVDKEADFAQSAESTEAGEGEEEEVDIDEEDVDEV
jgi:hypothetical protein